MNKGIKETKSDTKRSKNVSKIATRVISEKKKSPITDKDRSSSMNSLIIRERVRDDSSKKIVRSEVKPKMVDLNTNKTKIMNEHQKCGEDLKSPKNQSKKQSDGENFIEIAEDSVNFQKAKLNQKQQFFDQLIAKEGSIEKLLGVKKTAKTVYNVDGMSDIQIRESIDRVDEKTAKPFKFLTEIIDRTGEDNTKLARASKNRELDPTDIDLQLASLVKRVELNKTLLEKANQRIKDINFLTERNKAISIREMNYDEESFLKIKELGKTCEEPVSAADLTTVSHPAVDELQKTMTATIKMLGYVHKMSSGDLASGEIPTELTDYLSTPINVTIDDEYYKFWMRVQPSKINNH